MADSKAKGGEASPEFPARRGAAGMKVGYTDLAGNQVEIEADSHGYFHPEDAQAEKVLRDSFGLLTPGEAEQADAATAERAAAAEATTAAAEAPVVETAAPAAKEG